MSLSPGMRLGLYEVLAPLGAGGMGEVHRARDTRLGREVALKVLPEGVSRDPDRLSRFEQEARAASALNHPNIITIYEIGLFDSTPFIAMELVDGKTLRELSVSGPMPIRRVIDIVAQVAEGLAKAHAAGIVHRDLKPENVMVSKDGYVKILDFGLAKLVEPESGELSAMPTLARPETHPGTVLGTVGYMSPEQAGGQPLDFRSDQFSLGSILYEITSGQKPFSRKTAAESMSAIIREEPEALTKLRPDIPPPLRWIVERCMAKDPEERYASTRDLARDLESVRDHFSEVSSGPESLLAAPGRQGRRLLPVLGVGLAVLCLLAGWAARALWKKTPASAPSFHRLTFRSGLIGNARFAPDGQTIVYSARWEGERQRVFLTRPESPESRPFDFGAGPADILGVSSSGEMAILVGQTNVGTLARVPMAGGVPRQVVVGVPYASADWAPDGKDLVIVHRVNGRARLEYPIGKVILDSAHDIGFPRFSPRGDRIAFCEIGDVVSLIVVDSSGKGKKTLSTGWSDFSGVPCWRPNAEEIWFTAAARGQPLALYAINLSGKQRLVTRVPGNLELEDISRDGRPLLAHHTTVNILMGQAPDEEKERDLAWLDASMPADLSSDGKMLVLTEQGEGSGGSFSVYLRKTDGSPAVRLGEGTGIALSPDGNWVLVSVNRGLGKPEELVLLPTGPGETKALKSGNFQGFGGGTFSPDGKKIVFSATQPGHGSRIYVQDVAAGEPRAISPEGVYIVKSSNALSPDGRLVVGSEGPGKVSLYPLEEGEVHPIVGLEAEDRPVQWSADGRSLYVHRRAGNPNKVWQLDLESGRRSLFKEIRPGEPVAGLPRLLLTRDGKSYAYGTWRTLSELYVVDGLH